MDFPEEEWGLVEGESEGHPFFMSVNNGLKSFDGKSAYDYCLITTIRLEDMQGHRVPTEHEAEVLNRMEDILIEELSKLSIPLDTPPFCGFAAHGNPLKTNLSTIAEISTWP